MASTDTFTTVDVDHDKGTVVAVTIDADDGSIIRVDKVAFEPQNVQLPVKSENGTNIY